MDLEQLLSYQWGIMMPEFIILGVAFALSLMDLFMPKGQDRKILGWVAFTAIIASFVSLLGLVDLELSSILYDTFRLDSFAKAFKLVLLLGAALVMLLSVTYQPKEGMDEYKGEFYYLFLTALLGAMMMASSGDLITLFVGLELLSISSYILAGMRKNHLPSNESAMKYVINGSISSAVTLFGLSYVFGLTGTTNLSGITSVLSALYDTQQIYLLGLSFFLVFVGISFKLASVPFHMWAPDVYQGAPTPVTAFLSVVSKAAGFVLLLRIILSVYGAAPSNASSASYPLLLKMQDYMALLAAATMIIGNVIALRQRNIKRLFAYSSIAHAGYLLVAITALSSFMFDAMWFYLLAYTFMNIGAFAVIQIISGKYDQEDISAFAGLYKRSPWLAVTMGVFLLSLAGIPGTAGFIGKLNIFMGTFYVDPPHYVLAAIMIGATVVSYVYYFGIFTQMFFRPAPVLEKITVPVGLKVALVICVVATIGLGIFPNVALDYLHIHFGGFVDMFE